MQNSSHISTRRKRFTEVSELEQTHRDQKLLDRIANLYSQLTPGCNLPTALQHREQSGHSSEGVNEEECMKDNGELRGIIYLLTIFPLI